MGNQRNKFGKPFEGYLDIRSDFFNLETNDNNVEKLKKIDEFYRQQPKRKGCKLCATDFQDELFRRNEIKYFICKNCGHLNGEFEDTREYCESLYTPQDGNGEMKIYKDDDKKAYQFRTKSIYMPKAQFLHDQLTDIGLDSSKLKYIDIGSGAGHMVMAMRNIGLKNVLGYEVTTQNVNFANSINESEVLKEHQLDEIDNIITETDASVVTSIFMLEHVEKPLDLCRAIKKNKNIKYLLLAVPMFSIGVILEQAFPHIRKRSLGAGHTHLFTEDSIKWICEKVDFEILTNWWFGADAFDLHRFINMHLKKDIKKSSIAGTWDKMVLPALNNVQQAFDKQKLSSEVHMFIKVNS